MKKPLLLLVMFLSLNNALAEGYIRTGGMIGPHPQDFTYRFNGIRSDALIPLPSIRISPTKETETKPLGNGVTLTVQKVDAGDAFKRIDVSCKGVQTKTRVFACMSGIVVTAMSIDTSINEQDFIGKISQAINNGSATHNQSGVDYVIKANTRTQTISMTAKADAPESIEKIESEAESGLTDTLQVVPCNPAIHKCR